MTNREFAALMERLAAAWNACDGDATAACFSDDVTYADPLRYRFTSRADLRRFFELPAGETQTVTFHTVLFDETQQCGAVEYTYIGTHVYHGLVLIRVDDDLVKEWREYQHVDPRPWSEFVSGPPAESTANRPSSVHTD
jgi:hypothetical protein